MDSFQRISPNAMRTSKQFVSPASLFTCMLIFCCMAASVFADDQTDKTRKNDNVELQVVIPIGDGSNAVTDTDIRSQMLSEKLIKMGRAKSQSCTRCHGRSGMAKLANAIEWDRSIAEFVVKQLTELREGKRVHTVMSSIAEPLSDQDIALIAAWYQSVSPDAQNR